MTELSYKKENDDTSDRFGDKAKDRAVNRSERVSGDDLKRLTGDKCSNDLENNHPDISEAA